MADRNGNSDDNFMRPKMGQTFITLPVTFDYSGGRNESDKTRIAWTVILGVVGLIVCLGILFNKEGFFLTNIIVTCIVFWGILLFIRKILWKENKMKKEFLENQENDYERSTNDFFGIFAIQEVYPYVCRFRNGKSGVFIRLNKDVILGKYSESEFEHYEAIGDAYNLAGAGKVQLCHIDYMDNVGTDERLEQSFVDLSSVKQSALKDVLTDIFTYQQEQMMERVTTFDTYLFLWTGSDINAWNTIQNILSCFLDANYRSYHALDADDIRELCRVLYNLHDFSVIQAMSNAFAVESYNGVNAIKLINEDGSEEILGKTREQLDEERKLRIKEEEARKQEIKRRKSSKGKKKKEAEEDKDDVFNIFDD